MRSPVANDTRRVVFLTDDGADKMRVDAALLRQGLQPANAHVRSEQELMQTLDEGGNVILCASHWQGLDALDVLNIIRRGATRLPFIVVSHDTDSASIVAAIRGGASDYVPMARLEGLREAIDAALARPSRRSRAGDSDSPKPSPQQIVDLGLHLQAQIDHSHASMVFDGRYKSVFYHGHDLAELFDQREDPEEYENLWLHSGNEALKLQQMKQHMDTLMATVDVGPPRFVNY